MIAISSRQKDEKGEEEHLLDPLAREKRPV
jgi:hypothetical protein